MLLKFVADVLLARLSSWQRFFLPDTSSGRRLWLVLLTVVSDAARQSHKISFRCTALQDVLYNVSQDHRVSYLFPAQKENLLIHDLQRKRTCRMKRAHTNDDV